MKRRVIYAAIGINGLAITATLLFYAGRTPTNELPANAREAPANSSAKSSLEIVVAPGSVEPVSEEIEVGAEVSGRLREVRVEEGAAVMRGQVLAVLANGDYEAQLSSARAQIVSAESQRAAALARLEVARAELRRVVNGARVEERREARAAAEQSAAVKRNAQTEVERRRRLFASGDIAREELERAERDLRVAEAREQELRERFAFVNAKAREEDVSRAEAAVRLAEAQVREAEAQINEARARAEEARARLDKTHIRSPITGVVLRRRLQAGESVSLESDQPSIFTLADTSVLRVRVDVDERDVGRVKTGQRAYVTADAYGERRFWGRIIRVGQVLGKKNIRTEEPTERVDTKILETLVELNAEERLPAGLRVDAFILVGEGEAEARGRGNAN
jgi:HlyD family secretion protein